MRKIDTSEWGTFKLIDIGFTNDHGTRIKKSDRLDGDTIFLTAGKENQGIVGTIGNIIKVWHKPITIDMFGNAFYHDFDCAGDDNIYAFENNKLSKYVKSFIATVINLQNENIYSYTKQFRQNDVNKLSVKLPVDAHGNPDWDFMESYMRDIEARTCDKISRLERAIRYRGCAIDVSNWKGFKVGELFDIYLSKDDIQPKNIVDGKTPLVSSGKDNNGIMAYIENDSAKLWNSNTLTVDMFGKVFYQPNSYYCVSHGRVNILVPKNNMEKYELMFIATVIERITLSKYNFIQMCTSKKLKNDIIYLPTKNGTLDCNYMETFMKNIEKQVKEKLMIV